MTEEEEVKKRKKRRTRKAEINECTKDWKIR